MKTPFLLHLAAALSCAVFSSSTLAQGTAFTYQGSLDDNDSPANGFFDITYGLWDDAGAGLQVGDTITNTAVDVVAGVFTVTLDFGSGVFDGSDRWLEIGVRTNGGGAFNTLSPRQPITSAPYALKAGGVDAAGISGTIASNALANGSVTSEKLSPSIGVWTRSGNDISYTGGRVGIGASPNVPLEVDGEIRSTGPGGGRFLTRNPNNQSATAQFSWLGDVARIRIGGSGAGAGNGFDIQGIGDVSLLRVTESGDATVKRNLALGSSVTMRSTETGSDGADLQMRESSGVLTVNIDAQQSGGGSQIDLYNDAGTRTVRIDSDEIDSGKIQLFDSNGVSVINIDADSSLGGSLVQAQIMQITGGSDIAEPFEIHGATTQPGLVVSIDPDRPGELVVSTTEYDHKVAGIVSGAGGVRPGLTLSQEGSVADGSHPVALSGRVYCWVDADLSGGVAPGDLLTTSSTPGHAMKVREAMRAQGAIIGKAMSRLEGGRGLVLVLVALQ